MAHSSGFGLVGLLIVVAVVAVLGGGTFYWREIQHQRSIFQAGLEAEKRAMELKNQIEGRSQPSFAEIDISTWKTYRNEKYGFEVRYPVSFTAFVDVKDRSDRGRLEVEVTPAAQDSRSIYFSDRPSHFLCCEPLYVQIEILDERVTDFEAWLKDHKFMPPENDSRLKRKGYETFAGERAYYIFSEAGLDSYGSSIMMNHEGKLFLIRFNDDTATFINIVNSFKFIK